MSTIRITLIACIVTCFISIKSFSQAKDTIVLVKGQTLMGEVQYANLGNITIDDIDLKMQNVKLYKIKKLVVDEKLRIQTVDKKYYLGSLKTAEKEGWVNIHTTSGDTIAIPIINIYELISLEGGFFKRLKGNISAGFSFNKSSDIGQLNLGANILYSAKNLDYQFMMNSIGTIDSGTFSSDNINVQLLSDYALTETWFLVAGLQYQRNLELSIARRYLGLAGAGNQLFIKKNWRLQALTGIDFSQEKSIEDVSSGLLYEIPLMFQFNFYQFRHPDIQISSTQSVYFSLSQAGRVRYDGNTSFSWQIIRYFYLNLSPYTSFDSKPPAGNNSTFDYGVVFGISYKF
jgi:hypothetical protein